MNLLIPVPPAVLDSDAEMPLWLAVVLYAVLGLAAVYVLFMIYKDWRR